MELSRKEKRLKKDQEAFLKAFKVLHTLGNLDSVPLFNNEVIASTDFYIKVIPYLKKAGISFGMLTSRSFTYDDLNWLVDYTGDLIEGVRDEAKEDAPLEANLLMLLEEQTAKINAAFEAYNMHCDSGDLLCSEFEGADKARKREIRKKVNNHCLVAKNILYGICDLIDKETHLSTMITETRRKFNGRLAFLDSNGFKDPELKKSELPISSLAISMDKLLNNNAGLMDDIRREINNLMVNTSVSIGNSCSNDGTDESLDDCQPSENRYLTTLKCLVGGVSIDAEQEAFVEACVKNVLSLQEVTDGDYYRALTVFNIKPYSREHLVREETSNCPVLTMVL